MISMVQDRAADYVPSFAYINVYYIILAEYDIYGTGRQTMFPHLLILMFTIKIAEYDIYGQYSICDKTRGGRQSIFDVFLTQPVGVNENLRGLRCTMRGYPPDKSSTVNGTMVQGCRFLLVKPLSIDVSRLHYYYYYYYYADICTECAN